MRCIDTLKSGAQRNRSTQRNGGAGQSESAGGLVAVLDKLKKLQEKYAEKQEQFSAEFRAESNALVSQVNYNLFFALASFVLFHCRTPLLESRHWPCKRRAQIVRKVPVRCQRVVQLLRITPLHGRLALLHGWKQLLRAKTYLPVMKTVELLDWIPRPQGLGD